MILYAQKENGFEINRVLISETESENPEMLCLLLLLLLLLHCSQEIRKLLTVSLEAILHYDKPLLSYYEKSFGE